MAASLDRKSVDRNVGGGSFIDLATINCLVYWANMGTDTDRHRATDRQTQIDKYSETDIHAVQ